MEGTAEVDAPQLCRTETTDADWWLSVTYRLTPASGGTDAELVIHYEVPAGVFTRSWTG